MESTTRFTRTRKGFPAQVRRGKGCEEPKCDRRGGRRARGDVIGVRAAVVLALTFVISTHAAHADTLNRTVLPIPQPQRPPVTELDVRNAHTPPRLEVH